MHNSAVRIFPAETVVTTENNGTLTVDELETENYCPEQIKGPGFMTQFSTPPTRVYDVEEKKPPKVTRKPNRRERRAGAAKSRQSR